MERFGIGNVPQIFRKQLLKLFAIAALELLTFSLNYSQHFRLITKLGDDEMVNNDQLVTSPR